MTQWRVIQISDRALATVAGGASAGGSRCADGRRFSGFDGEPFRSSIPCPHACALGGELLFGDAAYHNLLAALREHAVCGVDIRRWLPALRETRKLQGVVTAVCDGAGWDAVREFAQVYW